MTRVVEKGETVVRGMRAGGLTLGMTNERLTGVAGLLASDSIS